MVEHRASGWVFKKFYYYFFKYCANMENCGSFRGFGYIYIDNIFSFTNTTTIVGIFANSQLLKKI